MVTELNSLQIDRLKNWSAFITLIIFSFMLLVGFWHLKTVLYPAIIALIASLRAMTKRSTTVQLTMLDLSLFVLLGYETLNYLLSPYEPNVFPFLLKINVVLIIYATLIINERQINTTQLILIIITFYGGLLALATAMQFIIFSFSLRANGFEEIYDYKIMFGPFGMAVNDWSATMFMFFIPSLALMINNWNNKSLRMSLLINSAAIMTAILITFSRGVYICIFSFLLSIPLLLRTLKVQWGGILEITWLLFILLIPFFILLHRPFIKTVRMLQTTSQVRSAEGRMELIQNGLAMVKNYPLNGIGTGNFAMYYPENNEKRSGDDTIILTRLSNTFLQILIDKGFVGFAIYAYIFVVFFRALCTQWRKAASFSEKACAGFYLLGTGAIFIKEMTFASLLSSDSFILLTVIWLAANRNASIPVVSFQLRRPVLLIFTAAMACYLGWLISKHERYKMADRYNTLGVTAYSQNRLADAEQYIDKAIKQTSNNALYHLNKGQLLISSYKPPFAIVDVLQRHQLSYDFTDKPKKAIDEFITALEQNPNDPMAANNLGWSYFYCGALTAARKYFDKACRTDPSEPLYNLSIALFHFHECQDSLAVFHFKRAINNCPSLLEGYLWQQIRRMYPSIAKAVETETVEELRKELQSSNSPIAMARLAKVLCSIGLVEEPRKLLRSVTTQLPNLNRPWLYLGDSLMSDNDALREISYKKAEFLDQHDYLPKLRLAKFYQYRSEYKYALAYYTSAVSTMPNIPIGSISSKLQRVYHSQLVIPSFFPKELLFSLVPEITPSLHCHRLIDVADKVGDEPLKAKLLQLSRSNNINFTQIETLLQSK